MSDITWKSKDLGPVDAYALAVAGGYTGTKEEWVAEISNASTNASNAEAYALGTRGGEAVDSDDPAYHNNSKYYEEQAAVQKEAAQDAAETASAAYNVNLLAPNFDATAAYPAGQHVIYDGGYYVLPAGHEANVTWANTSKTQITVGGESSDLKSAFALENRILQIGDYTVQADDLEQGVLSGTGAETESTTRIRSKAYIPIAKGTKIVFTPGTKTKEYAYHLYDEDFNHTDNSSWLGSGETRFSQNGYLRLLFSKGNNTDTITPSDYDATTVVKSISNMNTTDTRIALNNTTGNEIIEMTKGGYVSLSSSPITVSPSIPVVSSVNKQYAIVPCSEGDMFTINASGGATAKPWGFVSAEGVILLDSDNSGNITETNRFVTAPSGSAYLIINDNQAGYGISYHGNLVRNDLAKAISSIGSEKTEEIYWGNDKDLPPDTAHPSYVEAVGVKGNGDQFILNGTSPAVVRIMVSGNLERYNSATNYKNAPKTLKLKARHTYKAIVMLVGGSVTFDVSDTARTVAAMVVRDSEDNDLANIQLKPFMMINHAEFTVSSDNVGSIMLYVPASRTYTNCTVRIRLIDLYAEQGESIDSIYETEMATTIASVRALMTEPCLIFPKITDIHSKAPNAINPQQFAVTMRNIRYFVNQVSCDGLLCLGDMTDGGYSAYPASLSDGLPYVQYLMKQMHIDGLPLYFTIGNHDDFRYVTPYMTASQIYDYYMRESDKNVIPDPQSYGTNYYKDFPGYKTRLICFNTNLLPLTEKGAYGISARTLEWVEEVLEDMPSDYIGMMITHASIYNGINNIEHPYDITNSSELRAIIHNSGRLCFVLSGHMHFDISYQAENDVLVIGTGCTKMEGTTTYDVTTVDGITGGVRYARSVDDATSELWDVVVLRPFSKKLDLIRFGAGIDQHFDLA